MVQKKFKIKSKKALSSLTESVLSLAKNNPPVAKSPRADAVGEITIDEIIESTGGLVTDLQPEDRLYMETVVDGEADARATTVGAIASYINELLPTEEDVIYNWDVSIDGSDIDCSSIPEEYNTLNIKNADYEISLLYLQISKIKKITVSQTGKSKTITQDIGVDDTVIADDYISLDDISGTIYFYTGDKNSDEIFESRRYIIYKYISFSEDIQIYTYNLNKLVFSIEFNDDYTKILSYFGIDDFFIPFKYTASTSTLTKNNNVVYNVRQGSRSSGIDMLNVTTCAVYKDGSGTNDSQYRIINSSSLFTKSFNSGMLVIPHGNYTDKTDIDFIGTFYAKSVLYMEDTNANDIFLGTEKILAADDRIIHTKTSPAITLTQATQWIYSFTCAGKEVRIAGGSETRTEKCIYNGNATIANAVTDSSWSMSSSGSNSFSEAGCYSDSTIPHAISSFTYWEKGTSSTNTYLSSNYKNE